SLTAATASSKRSSFGSIWTTTRPVRSPSPTGARAWRRSGSRDSPLYVSTLVNLVAGVASREVALSKEERAVRQAVITSALATCWLLAAPLFASIGSWAAEQGTDGLGGALLYLEQGAIWRLDLASGQAAQWRGADGALVTYLAHSPDRQRLAYSVL